MDGKRTLMLLSVVAVAILIGGITLSAYSYNPLLGSENSSGFLTDEQRGEIMQIIHEMREENKAKIDAKLSEWELEPPILTDEQKNEIQRLKKDLRQNKASREEIKAEVDFKLCEWGIKVPVLTEEQRQEIRQIIHKMRQETESMINGKFEEWGINPPERMHPLRGFRRLLNSFAPITGG